MATFFTFLFAFACLATLFCGFRKQWAGARPWLAVTALGSFLLALLTAPVK